MTYKMLKIGPHHLLLGQLNNRKISQCWCPETLKFQRFQFQRLRYLNCRSNKKITFHMYSSRQ